MFAREQIFVFRHGRFAIIPAGQATAHQRAAAVRGTERARVVAEIRRNGDRWDLLALYRAATGLDPWLPASLPDEVVIAAIEVGFVSGRLLLVRIGEGATSLSHIDGGLRPTTEQDRLIQAALKDRVTLAFEGRRYGFISAERWSGPDSARGYVPIRAQQARELVKRMAAAQANTPSDQEAWQQLAAALADPRSGAGILLLRHTPATSGPSPRSGPAAETPSQLAPKVAQQDWIEIQIQYDDGTPFDGDCVLVLPGGRTTKGPPDAGGVVRVDGIDPGSCKLTFPDTFPDTGA